MAIDQRAVKFHTLGNKLVEEQKFNEAIVSYEKAIDLDPAYAAAHYHLAEAYEYKKLDDQAYGSYLKAIELNPAYATMHIDSGLDTLLSGPLGKAVAEYKKVKGVAKKSGVAVPSPKEGSPVAMATQPAVKKAQPRGQKGLKPLKVHLRPSDEHYSSEVGNVDTVIAEVFGPKEIPVAECKVTFKVRNEPPLDDAAVGADASQVEGGQGSKAIMLATDGDGRVTVYFKRARRAGLNRLEVRPEGGAAVFFEDHTHPGDVSRVDIMPPAKNFTTGQEVGFSFTAFDEFENRMEGLDLDVTLFGKKRQEWEIIDNMSGKTDSEGSLAHTFAMPTIGNLQCRMEVKHKKTEFKSEKVFKVIPGTASSMIFIPARNTVAPGEKFTLKMRLMDEFDNPIEGLPARIAQKEAIGGVWRMGAESGDITGEDGSVYVEITAPVEPGARVVYGVETNSLPESARIVAQFTTGQTMVADAPRMTGAPDEPDLDLDMTPSDLPGGGPGVERIESTGFKGDDLSLQLTGIELGAGDISGLPEIDAAPMPTLPEPRGKAVVQATSELVPGEGLTGGMSALEGLELDIGSPAPATMPQAPLAPLEKTPETGSSFDQLDSMLDTDYAAETKAASGFGNDIPSMKIPTEDVSEPAPAEYIEETVPREEPFAGPRTPDVSAGAENDTLPDEEASFDKLRDKREQYIDLKVEQEEITCRAGEVIPVKAQVVGADGRPVSAGVRVTYRIEEAGEGADSFFVTATGLQGEKTYETEPDLSGEVVSNVQVSSKCGSFIVIVEIESTRSRVVVNIAPAAPSVIELTTTGEKTTPGQIVNITAKMLDKYGNPVPGEFLTVMPEDYTGQPGTIRQDVTTTNEDGEVVVYYTASTNPGDTITLTAQNPSVGAFAVRKLSLMVEGVVAPAPSGAGGVEQTLKTAPPMAFELGGLPPLPGGGGLGGPAFEAVFQPVAPVSGPGVKPAPAPTGQQPVAVPSGAPADFSASDDSSSEKSEEEVDEYLKSLEPADPYSTAKFEIKRGKKPVMELRAVLPKILKYGAFLALLVMIAFGGLLSYKYFLFEYYNTQAIQMYTSDNLGEALVLFEKASEIKKQASEPLEYSAEIYIKQAEKSQDAGNEQQAESHYNNALKVLDKVLQINPNNINGLFMMGQVYEGKRSYCSALNQYERILKVDPNYQIAQSKISVLRDMCGSYRRIRKGGR